MATSAKTFDQVKNILGKLDQRIDAVRSRRVNGEPAATTGTEATTSAGTSPNGGEVLGLNTVVGGGRTNATATNSPAGGPIPAPIPMTQAQQQQQQQQNATPTGHPKYGRATPLRNIG